MSTLDGYEQRRVNAAGALLLDKNHDGPHAFREDGTCTIQFCTTTSQSCWCGHQCGHSNAHDCNPKEQP